MPRKSNRRMRHSSTGTHFSPRVKARIPLFAGLAVSLIVLIAGALIIGNSILNAPYPMSISPAKAHDEILKGAFLLDVRSEDEFIQGHIADSSLIPLEKLSSRLSDLPRDRLIIVVCRTGVRSAEGVKILRANGFSRSTSLSGGITAWTSAGYPLAAGAPISP